MGVASPDRMAMLAAVRRAPSARPERAAPAHAASVAGQELATRLRELGASAASPEDALDPMLHAILEATGAVAGALCLYDVAQQVLRLAAEVGLTDAGCRQLRTITRGDAESWGMPLHGMLNRRCYLIENAAQNRFVPPLIAEADRVETVACLPLYDADTPLASLILITRSPRVLGERELRGVEGPVQEIARLIETMRQRALGREGKPAAPPPVPRIGPASKGSAATPPPPGVPSADTARLAAELARAERERDRLAAELETLRRETHGNVETRAAALADLERLRTQVIEAEAAAARERAARADVEGHFADGAATGRQELLRAHEALGTAESARAAAIAETARLRADLDRIDKARVSSSGEAEARITQLFTEIDQLRARLAEAEAGAAHEQRARDELQARLAAGVSAGQEDLRKAFEEAREAERVRAAAVTEAAQLRTELEHVRQAARAQASGVSARLDEAETQLEAQLETLREALREDHAVELAALGARVETLAADTDRLREAEATISAERDRLAADLEGMAAARAHLEEALKSTLEEARAHSEETTAQLREARVQAWDVAARLTDAETELAASRDEHTAAITALHAQLGTAREEHAGEIESLAAKLQTLAVEADQLRAAQAGVDAERDQLAADLAAAHAAQAQLDETLQQVLRETRYPDATPATPKAPPAKQTTGDAPVEPAVQAPPSAPTPAARAVAPASPARALELEERLVAVLDGDPAWGGVALDKHEVVVLAPDDDIVARLEEVRPGRVVGNLAVPGVLRALVAIREARVPTRLWGCIADATAGRALALRLIEPAARPLAPDMVVASLSSSAAKGARVVTVGADTDALLSLRQALTRHGMSVSMAWDEKQASDMVEMVRPGVVVVDLSMQREACAFVARLAWTNPVPTVVLIEGTSDTAASFAATLGDRAHASQMTPLKTLLANVVGRF